MIFCFSPQVTYTVQMGWLSIINWVTNISRLGTFNKTHVSLEFNPLCNVICSVASLSAPKDSTESLLQAKYHWHVNGFYEQILENYESELNILQVIAVYSVETEQKEGE